MFTGRDSHSILMACRMYGIMRFEVQLKKDALHPAQTTILNKEIIECLLGKYF
jgi:hypothetical protein